MKKWQEMNRSTWGDGTHANAEVMIGPRRAYTEAQRDAANEECAHPVSLPSGSLESARLSAGGMCTGTVSEKETVGGVSSDPCKRVHQRLGDGSDITRLGCNADVGVKPEGDIANVVGNVGTDSRCRIPERVAVSTPDLFRSVEESRLDTDECSVGISDEDADSATPVPKPVIQDSGPMGSCWAFGPRVTSEEYAAWKQRQSRKPVAGSLSPLEYANGALSPVSEANNGWFQIEVTVDSGACDTVMPLSMCEGIDVIPSLASLRGMNYEVANGQLIPNLGERRCEIITPGSKRHKSITFQVADVHKPLLSVSSVASMGYECILNKDGGWLINRAAHEAIPLQRKGNMYVFTCWLRKSPFGRQGS